MHGSGILVCDFQRPSKLSQVLPHESKAYMVGWEFNENELSASSTHPLLVLSISNEVLSSDLRTSFFRIKF